VTRRRLALLVLALALAAGGLVAWRATRRPDPIRYDTAAADRGPLTAKVTASGTLSALVTVQVGSQVSGRVAEVLVDFNAHVKKGQLIARIDPQLFDAAVEQARANLAASRGNLEKARAQAVDAERVAKRTAALAESKLVALADRDTAESNADAARAGVAAAQGQVAQTQAALHQAEVNLAYTRILSPTSGTVISRNVDVGQTVAASLQAPTLFVIAEDLARMQVDTNVAEADVGKLKAGMPATFTVDAFPGERFEGVVRQIRYAAQTVQNVVTYDAVIDVSNPELKLRPGMTANVTFVYADRDDVLRVPNAALRFRPSADVLAALRSAGGGPAGAAPEGERGAASGGPVNAGAARGAGRGGGGAPGEAGANGGARGAAGGAATRARGREEPGRRTLWVLRGGKPVEMRIRTGISDGTFTEVLEGDLQAGDACVVDASGGAAPARPAGGGGGMGGGRGPRLL
jgi:HlyD family secretion protein